MPAESVIRNGAPCERSLQTFGPGINASAGLARGAIALRLDREWLLDAMRQLIRRALVEDRELVREIIRGLGYLRTSEAARYCGVSTDTLRRAMRRRDLPHIDKGYRTKLIRICDLDDWLSRFRRKSRFDALS